MEITVTIEAKRKSIRAGNAKPGSFVVASKDTGVVQAGDLLNVTSPLTMTNLRTNRDVLFHNNEQVHPVDSGTIEIKDGVVESAELELVKDDPEIKTLDRVGPGKLAVVVEAPGTWDWKPGDLVVNEWDGAFNLLRRTRSTSENRRLVKVEVLPEGSKVEIVV